MFRPPHTGGHPTLMPPSRSGSRAACPVIGVGLLPRIFDVSEKGNPDGCFLASDVILDDSRVAIWKPLFIEIHREFVMVARYCVRWQHNGDGVVRGRDR